MSRHFSRASLHTVASVVTAVVLWVAVLRSAERPCCSFASVKLDALALGDLGKYWALNSAELRENSTATWGYVELQSLSSTPITGAQFYGEYFDAEGRFCFSLAFSLASNEEGRNSPIRPGEVRTLRSMAACLSPAVSPKGLRLYLVRQTGLTGERIEGEASPPMRLPPVASGGTTEKLSSLILEGGLTQPDDSVRDLALARVRVDSLGRAEEAVVLHAISGELAQWVQDYVSGNRFIPASRGGVPEAADTLVLVRALASRRAFSNSDFLPRLSPWVTTYLAGTYDNEVPPISTVLFWPAPTRAKRLGSADWIDLPPPPPGLFSILSDGAAWCPDLFELKAGQISGQFFFDWRK